MMDGTMYADGTKLRSPDELVAAARAARAANPDVRARVSADAHAKHGQVILAVDLLKQGGISRIAFGITKEL